MDDLEAAMAWFDHILRPLPFIMSARAMPAFQVDFSGL